MLVEPLAEVDVNVPGVIAILVAPAAAQLSVLLVPEFMLVGFAVKDVIVGTEPFPEDELNELADEQPAKQVSSVRTNAQRSSPEGVSLRELSLFPQNELGESMRNPFVAGVHTSLVISDSSCLLVASTESGSWSTNGNGQQLSANHALV
jgi:hypothetical protein